MKNIHFLFIALLLVAACKCNNGPDKTSDSDTELVIPDTLLVYEVNTEDKIMKKFTEMPDSAYTATRVINGLNEKYSNVRLQFIKQRNDTLFVAVPSNEFLGEKMGSSGASSWFQDAVINLTSVPGIKYVNIDMEKRSHAMPGTFSKENTKEYKEVKDSIPVS